MPFSEPEKKCCFCGETASEELVPTEDRKRWKCSDMGACLYNMSYLE